MFLKTKAEKGASSLKIISFFSSVFKGSDAIRVPLREGSGRYCTISSNKSLIPLSVKAEPTITGKSLRLFTAKESPPLISSTESLKTARYFSSRLSSLSAMASINTGSSRDSIITQLFDKLDFKSASTALTFTPSLSVLLIKIIQGSPASSSICQAFSVPTCTPLKASTTIIALSTARKPQIISPLKSAYPGASIICMRCP
ncbi:MAG: hypothetical protein BWY16_01057 [Candidatus Omnitrophica bacterium ADurb.Bin205]|nr:MAG: hypothetical protein BWY16_01057 [Candidatus Omnitrophica bacterium ADurb.Bin205]